MTFDLQLHVVAFFSMFSKGASVKKSQPGGSCWCGCAHSKRGGSCQCMWAQSKVSRTRM